MCNAVVALLCSDETGEIVISSPNDLGELFWSVELLLWNSSTTLYPMTYYIVHPVYLYEICCIPMPLH